LSKYPSDWPDFEFVVGSFSTTPALDTSLNYAFIETALITPQSRGNITINSTDTSVPPIIDVGWLSNPIDVEMAIAAVRRGRDFWGAKSILPIRLGEEARPSSNTTTYAELEEYVRKGVTTVYHASCTCAMGADDDPMAVIDSRARVFGVNGLRVVDASSFPFLPPGHPQSTICEFIGLMEFLCVWMLTLSRCAWREDCGRYHPRTIKLKRKHSWSIIDVEDTACIALTTNESFTRLWML
jgi:choline dehydrogenase